MVPPAQRATTEDTQAKHLFGYFFFFYFLQLLTVLLEQEAASKLGPSLKRDWQ